MERHPRNRAAVANLVHELLIPLALVGAVLGVTRLARPPEGFDGCPPPPEVVQLIQKHARSHPVRMH